MGKLVQFDKRRRERKPPPDRAGDATILIFTGIRYERDSTTLPGKPPANARPKRKRG